MSLATLPPTVSGAGDDFDDWESELATQPLGEPLPDPEARPLRPSRAADRRSAIEQINEELGIRRHRKSDREA